MKIDRAELFRYELPLLSPLPRVSSLKAGGFVVAADTDTGRRYAEVADAALVQDETGATVQEQLKKALLNGCQSDDQSCAPVKWAMSSLFCDEAFPRVQLPLNTLLDASSPDMVDQGSARYTEGFRCFKIKIGDAALDEEISRIFELWKVLGKEVRFRLDGNRKLTLEAGIEFARALKKTKIEYFEEPFADVADIEEFFRLTGNRIALDETVLDPDFMKWACHDAVCAYVIKPTRLGAKKEFDEVTLLAKKLGRSVVVTSTFETGIGLIALAKAAGRYPSMAMGLATGSYFAADLVSPPLRPFRGQMMMGALQAHLHHVNLEESRFCQRILEWP